MIPDGSEKKLVIPLKVVWGEFYYFYGGRLPILPNGTMCDLIVPASAIEDRDFLFRLEARHVEELLPAGETILTAVSTARVPTDWRKRAYSPEQIGDPFGGDLAKDVSTKLSINNPDSLFVEIILKDPLGLDLRGTKHGRLIRASCVIPALDGKEAVSLNHAYRLISEAFEPDRISHVGNVFRKMVHLDNQEGCFLLNDLRAKVEAEFERELVHPDLPKGFYDGPKFPPEESA